MEGLGTRRNKAIKRTKGHRPCDSPETGEESDDTEPTPFIGILQQKDVLASQCNEEKRIFSGPVGQWAKWGPYLSERQWATVREDTSADGNCWESFSHDEAVYRAYTSGEDGLMGISDNEGNLCLALALWNGKDPILKERLFGLTGQQGNHGEDVKECYYYQDGCPSHAYMKGCYVYPQNEFPYHDLLYENAKRGCEDPEYELHDTGVLDDKKYWKIEVEYVKDTAHDLLIKYTIHNRGLSAAKLHLLPTLWYRHIPPMEGLFNYKLRPKTQLTLVQEGPDTVCCSEGDYIFKVDALLGKFPKLLFTDNETNVKRQQNERQPHGDNIPRSSADIQPTDSESSMPDCKPEHYFKDAFHQYIVNNDTSAVNPSNTGMKCCAVYELEVEADQQVVVRCLLCKKQTRKLKNFGKKFDNIVEERKKDTNVFYNKVIPPSVDKDHYNLARQAYAGLLWNKQFYTYSVSTWLKGQPDASKARNRQWGHFICKDILSMPDKWEFPWFASWDLSFQAVTFSHIDPGFAKYQLALLLSARFLRADGRLPGCEFDFSDPNPPVQAWACLEVYKQALPPGDRDLTFLLRCYPGLESNYEWWMNRSLMFGHKPYRCGFLGMDNISVFDRSHPPKRCWLTQVDAIAWAAFMCVNMIELSLELQLGKCNPSHDYSENIERYISDFRMMVEDLHRNRNEKTLLGQHCLWNEEDGFFYDCLDRSQDTCMRIRSLVGLVPLFATLILDEDRLNQALRDALKDQMNSGKSSIFIKQDEDGRTQYLFSMVEESQLKRILDYVLDENEFLSPFGIRSLSKCHESSPFHTKVLDAEYSISYCPGESTSEMFGGNSNWRGPIWLPMNYLIIEALLKFYQYLGPKFTMEFPTGSGNRHTLKHVALDIARRVLSIFLPDTKGKRPCHGGHAMYEEQEWRDLILFYEYFHAETGRGCGASHQTGWSALVVNLMRLVTNNNNEAASFSTKST